MAIAGTTTNVSDEPGVTRSNFVSRFQSSTVFAAVSLSLVFIISFLYHPADSPNYTICPFKLVTGLDCPGCGMTRAFCAISQGHLGKAFYFNKLSPFVYLAFVLIWCWSLVDLLQLHQIAGLIRRIPHRLQSLFPAEQIAFGCVISYWILRVALNLAGSHF